MLLPHFQPMIFGSSIMSKNVDLSQKCVSFKLSLVGFFGLFDSISCTHPDLLRLSGNLIDWAFLTPRGFFVSRTIFLNFSKNTKDRRPQLFLDFFFHPHSGIHYHFLVLYSFLLSPRRLSLSPAQTVQSRNFSLKLCTT